MKINTKDLEKAKKEIHSSTKPIIIQAQDNIFNRKILDYGKFDILLSPETGEKRNTVRQINSGFNHVLGKIATKNKISIGIDLNEISSLDKIGRASRLTKIKQNIDICKKTKTILKIIGNKKQGFHFLISLGASTEQAKKAIS